MRVPPPGGALGAEQYDGGADPGGVSFDPALTPHEREVLRRQFSRCRFDLVGRSTIDERIALVRWTPFQTGNAGGPTPVFFPPNQATYVVDLSSQDAHDGASPGWDASAPRTPEAVRRLDNTAALAAAYPGHFPGVQVREPWWLRIRRVWYAVIPLAIVVLATIWLALVLRHPWQP